MNTNKIIPLENAQSYRRLYDKRISEELSGDGLIDDFLNGYIFKITGGFDKQGFAMKAGVMTDFRVEHLLLDGKSGHLWPWRKGERRRKAVRGCIVSYDIGVINMVIVKKGDRDIEGLTDPKSYKPSRLGPKRANKIRKLFRLDPNDDVRPYVVRREAKTKKRRIYVESQKKFIVDPESPPIKSRIKAPRIQRLITPLSLQRKRKKYLDMKKRHEKRQKEAVEYSKVLASIRKEKKAKKLDKRRKI